MQIVHRGNRFGKTTEMVKLALEHDAYIVVATRADAIRLREQYPEIRFPITWGEFVRGRLGGAHTNTTKVVIDDLDRCIEMLVPSVKILGASLNDDEAKHF